MSHYKSNLRDIEFNLFEVLRRDEVLGEGPFADVDVDTARSILSEVDRLAREDLAESFVDGDRNPPVFDPQLKGFQGMTLTRDYDVNQYTFGAEKTFFDRLASVEVRIQDVRHSA